MKATILAGWADYWERLRETLLNPKVNESALEKSLCKARAQIPLPVFWLLGKTQAGKTSIIRALTRSERAEIGNGFQSCTQSSSFYDYPVDVPVIRFLDTRGLGEVAYDPNEDLQYCESQAHLLFAVMKVADSRQDAVLDVLRLVRQRHPEWPLLIAQTGLHELYPPDGEHIYPFPYDADPFSSEIPEELQQALLFQRRAAEKLPGFAPIRWVAIDFTLPEDGFEPSDYGLCALWQEIEFLSSIGLQQLLSEDSTVRDLFAQTAHHHIIGHTITAAGLGSLPVVDLVAVSAVQAKLLHSLAALYEQRWEKHNVIEFLGFIGVGITSGFLMRMLGRSAAKVIPFWGQTLGAVWGASVSGAATYALGKTSVYFFERRKDGLNVDTETLRSVYIEAFKKSGFMLKAHFRN